MHKGFSWWERCFVLGQSFLKFLEKDIKVAINVTLPDTTHRSTYLSHFKMRPVGMTSLKWDFKNHGLFTCLDSMIVIMHDRVFQFEFQSESHISYLQVL